MGQNTLDVFIALDRQRIIAPCFLQINGVIPLPSEPQAFTWGGITTDVIMVKLMPRSVRSPYAFGQVRSMSFGLQFNNTTYQPGDLSVWIPDTNFLHRLKPSVVNTLTPGDNQFGFPSISGQININANVDSTVFLLKELDFNVAGPTPANVCFCVGELALQNWDVQPFVIGAG